MSILEEIAEAMLAAAAFALPYWLAVILVGMGIIAFRRRIGIKLSIAATGILAVATWLGSIWLGSQCKTCNYVDRIYQMEVRWGLLFWEVTILGVLLVAFAFDRIQAKNGVREDQ